jgi:hypothetical protein
MIISIKECGSQKVKLTLPVLAVDNLRDFMPADVGAKLDSRGIDVDTLVKNVRRNGYRPQEVFSLIDGNREIMVYLK